MTVNFYTVLGIGQLASQDEIRKAYLKMAKQFHPDKNTQGAEKFKEIGNAYDTLSGVESRRKHDAELLVARTAAAGSSNGSCYSSRYRSSFTTNDAPNYTKRRKAAPTGHFFPRSPPPPRTPSPPPPPPKRSDYDIKTTTRITLNQSFTGLAQHHDCKGKKRKERGFHIPIAKGIHNYHTLKVNHRGNVMPDGVTRGDVVIEVLVDVESADGAFKRRGDNLYLELNVDLRDAILGYGSRPAFKHLDGRPVYISQTPGTVLKPGSQIIIPGDGMPIFMSVNNACGDIHVTFNVVFPDFVNIPESVDDRKVINELFMTEKEREAKENAIVIDDDEDDDESNSEDAYINIQSTNTPVNPHDSGNERNGHYELIDSEDDF
ncbi:hypothetical protein HPULCUR_010965 [Helicostylum pulchrum]|uniref:J domain-containing protein n=1 Tax=Helicostylum pulchrum TaxID=562976 RepID=A0ABP9YES1_9FUNG